MRRSSSRRLKRFESDRIVAGRASVYPAAFADWLPFPSSHPAAAPNWAQQKATTTATTTTTIATATTITTTAAGFSRPAAATTAAATAARSGPI